MKYLEHIYKISPKLRIDGKNTSSSVVLNDNGTLYVLTAKHCLNDLISKISLDFYNTSNGKFESYDLAYNDYEMISTDESIDMAILKLKAGVLMPEIPSIKLANDVFSKKKEFFLQGFFTGNEFRKSEKIKVYYTDLEENGFRVGTNEKLDDEVNSAQENVVGLSGSGCFFEINQDIYLIGITKKFVSKIQRFIILDFEQIRKNISQIKIYDVSQIPFDSPNIELIRDFKRQLSEAEEYIYHFKPTTAQIEVERIQKSIELSSIPSKDKDILLAECFFIKGIALISLEQNGNESNELLLKAYNLVPNEIKYKERAASVFYIIDKQDTRIPILIEEVLSKDPYNPKVWALKNTLSDTEIVIPKLVLVKPKYRYSTFILRIGEVRTFNMNELNVDFGHISEDEISINSDDITYDTFQYYMFLGIYFLNSGNDNIRKLSKVKKKPTSKATKGANILRILIEKLSNSELQNTNDYKQTYFFFEYSKYKVEPTKRQALRLYDLFIDDEFTSKFLFKAFEIVFALLDYDLHNEIIEVINTTKVEEIDISYKLLKSRSLQALGNNNEAITCLFEYLKDIDILDNLDLNNTSEAINILQSLGSDSNEIYLTLQGKRFGKPYYKNLLDSYTLRLTQDEETKCYDIAHDVIQSYWSELEHNEQIMVIAILASTGYLDKAIELFKPILNIEKDRNIEKDKHYKDIYIQILWFNGKHNIELLQLLRDWRLYNEPQETFLKYEIQLSLQLDNYAQIEEICTLGIASFPMNNEFKYHLICALFKQNKLDTVSPYLDDSLLNLILVPEAMIHLAEICIRANKIILGLELAYQQVKKIPDNIDIQMSYWSLFLLIDNEYFETQEKHTLVEIGTVVKFEIENETDFFDVTNTSLASNPIIASIYQKQIGETVLVTTHVHTNTGKILGIYDKYQGELNRISSKIEKPLSGGLPVKSLKFENSDDGSFDIELFNQKLQNEFGIDGYIRQLEQNKIIEQYQNKEIGFFSLCISLFSGNFITCFDAITRDINFGVIIVPLMYQREIKFTQDVSFVLDLTSILLFHTLSNHISFQDYNFYIAQSTKDIIINSIYELQSSLQDTMAITILPDKVIPFFYPDNHREIKLKKLNCVLDWVNENCKIDYPTHIIDERKIMELLRTCSTLKKSVLTNLLITQKGNKILISDDFFYHKSNASASVEIISTEYFIRQMNPQLWEYAKLEMIQMNYKGLTLTTDTLINIFEKTRIITNMNSNHLSSAFENLEGSYNPQVGNVDEALGFIKYLFSISSDRGRKIMITKLIFTAILKDPYIEISNRSLETLYSKIELVLYLLGDAPTIVKKCLDDVWHNKLFRN